MVQKYIINLLNILSGKSTWLVVMCVILIIYSLITVYAGFKDEALHSKLYKKEQRILDLISVASTVEAERLLKDLHHPSDALAPIISRDSIVSWREYWAIRKVHLEEMLQ